MELFFILMIAIVIGVAIGADANARGMSGPLWGFLCFAFGIIFIPLYLIVRKPR